MDKISDISSQDTLIPKGVHFVVSNVCVGWCKCMYNYAGVFLYA